MNEELRETNENIEKESEVLVDVRDVSMCYKILVEKVDNLKEYVVKLLKRKIKYKELWALKDVSLQVKRGVSLGIIGRNGAGKSTLLKLISGVLEPTEGEIITKGNIVPLLKLGAGFDKNATGRENIYLNGAMMGYSRKEMDEKMDSILAFADLGTDIDLPLKNYSSGMVSILGFSIAVDVNPDILIVDEVLSVGDAPFREKCAKKIKELQEKGTTFIIVSHDQSTILRMCQEAVWINNNRIADFGDTKTVMDEYNQYCKEHPERDNSQSKYARHE
ncbi:MAG: ABC transporter ATP-binding protein [Clostridia bacterium]|nr:ABC transporter ATP-binding protein [Clostridia bacterium]